ncbi:unnamed protein product [Phytophthora fragariaefolia]|uniref:Unnamed protein product n=1 Tax=Phytophthora fragariaefolia TaxID=1490495 RepID=A0A9W7CWA7_9STRA|nr:unnamed protein product [Phytophthora fragariaefolia]
MADYFSSSTAGKWRGRPRTTLPTVFDVDPVSSGYDFRLRNSVDLEQHRKPATAKSQWKALERAIVDALPAKGDPTYADTTQS